jgi:hypothetical protein
MGLEDLEESVGQRHCLPVVTAVDVNLTAARLHRRKHLLAAEPLEQADDRLAGARVESIVETRHKQGDAHVSHLWRQTIQPKHRRALNVHA